MPEFLIPYNFVRTTEISTGQKKSPGIMHDKFSGYSGKIVCQLTPKTRTIIAENPGFGSAHELSQICDNDGKPFLPSSSLKGMFRSVAEAVANGCYLLFDKKYHYKHINHPIDVDVSRKIRGIASSPCSDINHLCICCRLFGMVGKQDDVQAEGKAIFGGKVSIGDATTTKDDYLEGSYNNKLVVKGIMTPKPHHDLFYEMNGLIRGRKFYYHRRDNELKAILNGDVGEFDKSFVKWIKAEALFQFTVNFSNLEKDELGLLLYALELEEKKVNNEKVGMYHKIGMAKAQGFGSCEIKITRLELMDNPQSRYQNFGTGITDALNKKLDFQKHFFQSYFGKDWIQKDALPNIFDLQRIMSLNGYQCHNMHHPEQTWFGTDEGRKPLPTIEDVFLNRNMLIE